MRCKQCGAEMGDGVRFCSQCGTQMSQNTFCVSCGAKLLPGQMFCTNCGLKIDDSAIRHDSEVESAKEYAKSVGGDTGKLIRKISSVTKFQGKPVLGVANKIGILAIYEDRVEFVRKGGLTLATTISSLAKNQIEAYYFSDLISVTTGNYLAIYTTLVLNLKNGNSISFCPAIPGTKDMETVANLLLHYL